MALLTMEQDNLIIETKNSPAFTISAGSAGTYATHYSIDVSKSGYTPIGATLYSVRYPGTYAVVLQLQGNTLYEVIYRATTLSASFSGAAGDIIASVIYKKN